MTLFYDTVLKSFETCHYLSHCINLSLRSAKVHNCKISISFACRTDVDKRFDHLLDNTQMLQAKNRLLGMYLSTLSTLSF